jgi:hypothetical protein
LQDTIKLISRIFFLLFFNWVQSFLGCLSLKKKIFFFFHSLISSRGSQNCKLILPFSFFFCFLSFSPNFFFFFWQWKRALQKVYFWGKTPFATSFGIFYLYWVPFFAKDPSKG